MKIKRPKLLKESFKIIVVGFSSFPLKSRHIGQTTESTLFPAPCLIGCAQKQRWCTSLGSAELSQLWPTGSGREYKLLQAAHAYLSVVLNCSSFCHPVYHLQPPPPAAADPPPPSSASCFPSPRTHNMRGEDEMRQQ
jgi:hypothetical protein